MEAASPSSSAPSPPFIAVAVPVLNEERYIGPCLDSLLAQWPHDRMQILVLDGGSTDGTAAVVATYAGRHACVTLMPNPVRLQSAACNLAARIADPRAKLLLRADAHASYPPGFVQGCLDAMQRTGATSVVVPMRTVPDPVADHVDDLGAAVRGAAAGAGTQRAIAAAQNSRLGNGGSAHRSGGGSRWVEHGHHALFDRAFFQRVGGYDETFSHNEDAELDRRAQRAGGRIWMHADAPVAYYPRRDLASLFRQYVRHGRGRARTLLKHRARPRLRQVLPLFVLAGCLGGLLLTPLHPAFGLAPLGYALLCLGWGAARAGQDGDLALLAMGPAAMAMHLGWAIGFLDGTLLRRLRQRQPVRPTEPVVGRWPGNGGRRPSA